jgi:hypothetical protein
MRRSAVFALGFLVLAGLRNLATGQEPEGSSTTAPQTSRMPRLSNEEAWQRLPELEAGERDKPLPNWAQTLAGPLPRTTAAMLELDFRYRTSEAFDPKLRATLRWVAAKANRCEYSRRYAEADLQRLGAGEHALVELTEKGLAERPANERAAIVFAEQLSLSASLITDKQVAELVEAYGEPAVVAMVLQLAYANFQDRLLLALGAQLEPDGPLAPLDVRFKPAAKDESIAAARPDAADDPETTAEAPEIEPAWGAVPLAELIRGMDQQKERPGRVSVPDWLDVHAKLPAGAYPADRPLRIKWSLVVLGNQPEMGMAWMNCLRSFGREANQDRVFEESLFWVITRSIDCFY